MPIHDPHHIVTAAAMVPPTNPLKFLPAKYRRLLYAAGWTVALGLGAYEASDGDWLKAGIMFLGSLGFGTAHSNVTK